MGGGAGTAQPVRAQLLQAGGRQAVRPQIDAERARPFVPFRPVARIERQHWHSGHAQRIGDDRAVHRLDDQQPCAEQRCERLLDCACALFLSAHGRLCVEE
jgi:hypothetical protein